VLGTVARDGARYLADRHAKKKQAGREGTGTSDRRRLPGRGPAPAPARSRRRFKRRWLVVPTLSLLLLGLLAVLGVIWLVAVLVGMG
jgi:eukaryotic-like serine/threonine-protein kinase